jgi:hypothetical protein
VKRLLKQLAIALAVAAVAVPLARATDYDGYKSGYPQLHTILTYHQPKYDGYKSGYPQLHAALSHQVAAPPVRTAERGFVWRDAAIGAAAAAGFIFLLASGAVSLNRRRTRLALGQANGVISR